MTIGKFISALLLLGTLSLPALAQTLIGGTVYQIDNQGVYIQNDSGITFVPVSAKFRRGSVVYAPGDLGVGMDVIAAFDGSYAQEYIPAPYYKSHPDWDWSHQLAGWRQDRIYWHYENGVWSR